MMFLNLDIHKYPVMLTRNRSDEVVSRRVV